MQMMKIITMSICLLIYGFQNSTAWYEYEKEVGTATLDFCKETGTSCLNWKMIMDYIDVYLIHCPCPIGELEGNL